jgi:hypothetical protein
MKEAEESKEEAKKRISQSKSTNELKYHPNPTGGPFRCENLGPRIRCMDFPLLIGVNVLFAVLTTLIWTTQLAPKKAKGRRKTGYQREEFTIDPGNVPEFKPSWRESR